ncbi:MAG: threonine synthase [Planctomycetes bacterium]|jgi:threonine synthase|nr:threonine synthase [Phycisphaerae bacterium]NBB95495.1 threonine synthase [Planctomycetota bacterium]
MKYISTRGQIKPIGFQDAVMMGLADDGGLIVPESIPSVADRLDELAAMDYPALACEIIGLFATDIPTNDLRELMRRTYGERYFTNDEAGLSGGGRVAPSVPVGDLHILELWHGPTLAFKDVALQLLGNLFEYILARRGGRLNILGATSGDTGSAAIHGCRGRDGLDIFIMHPRGRVSEIQRRQMTSVLDANVHNLAVEGSFDDCQRIMKTLASDIDFKRTYSLGAVNSVNWARVLAQIVYYFKAAFDVTAATGAQAVRVSVPTGNFGDILAGYYARRMGAPISGLILATNENDILSRFFNTGVYSLGEVYRTLSPSMDIQVASNFERYLFYKVGCDGGRIREMMEQFGKTGSLEIETDGPVDPLFTAGAADRQAVLATIRDTYRQHNYVLDPHTACGVHVANQQPGGDPLVCLATAHPAKFPDAVAAATGRDDLATHPCIAELMAAEERCTVLPEDIEAVRSFIENTVAGHSA